MKTYLDKIQTLKAWLKDADAILIGAGSGFSTAAGLEYSGSRFERYFADFKKKYGITDMYSGGFYPFPDAETYWAWWSSHIWYNRYETNVNEVYKVLRKLIGEKPYFVITTNVDNQFQLNGFENAKIFCPQGDYGLLQCSKGCHTKTYDNKELIREMVHCQKAMRVPSSLIPCCPICSSPMIPHLRCDDTFVQDEAWYEAEKAYEKFLEEYEGKKLLLLEMGVGMNTPTWIKFPFWRITYANSEARLVAVNKEREYLPEEIKSRSIYLDEDIAVVLKTVGENL